MVAEGCAALREQMTREIGRDCASGPRIGSAPFAGPQKKRLDEALSAAITRAPRAKSGMARTKLQPQHGSTNRNIPTPHQIPLPVHAGTSVPIPTMYPCVLFRNPINV
jgi:hypothetical protein